MVRETGDESKPVLGPENAQLAVWGMEYRQGEGWRKTLLTDGERVQRRGT